ncbi:hypothetical protein M378DRAFT_17767 [Amanita muscaria Koide BX008]|uniref:Uncharacterized protein n=1 Tax=Amanita muscaria (strain Koide BX008) TaxID=946122 RepID=A0A0C2W3G1_AMAMK|nr:hypothetical protein M378DRAFT_17767 [Amanita muscaria Koide BX008]
MSGQVSPLMVQTVNDESRQQQHSHRKPEAVPDISDQAQQQPSPPPTATAQSSIAPVGKPTPSKLIRRVWISSIVCEDGEEENEALTQATNRHDVASRADSSKLLKITCRSIEQQRLAGLLPCTT